MPFIDFIPCANDICKSPEHNPPGMIVLPAGLHIWKCPKCGQETPVRIRKVTCSK